MVKLFLGKYRTKSIRLSGWDYSQNGYYFVTICTKNRAYFFGDVINRKMVLSEMGTIANKFWLEIPQHFDNVKLDKFVIMPNHVHGIVVIENGDDIYRGSGRNAIYRVSTTKTGGITGKHNPMLSNNSLSKIMHVYKSAVTRFFTKNDFDHFAWQSRFHDHIVRTEPELNRIRQYIINNPVKWVQDKNNLENLHI